MTQYAERMAFVMQADPLEEELLFSLSPVRPDPEFINRLGQRLKREPSIVLEKRTFLGVYLVVASGLFGGVLLIWLLGLIYQLLHRFIR